MKKVEEIKRIINGHRPLLRKKFKVKEIVIFGSYVRGKPKKKSDLDMIIEFESEESIEGLDFVGLMIDLEKYLKRILGIKIHLASKRQAIESNKWKYIKEKLIYV